MALIINCTQCGDILEASSHRTQAEAIAELLDVGAEIEGDPSDPVVWCASCARQRRKRNGHVLARDRDL